MDSHVPQTSDLDLLLVGLSLGVVLVLVNLVAEGVLGGGNTINR